MNKMTKREKQKAQRKYAPWAVAIAIVLLVIGSVSLFINHNVYNPEVFAKKTTEAMQSEKVREAIAREVTSNVLPDQGSLTYRLLADPVESLITSMLTTNAFASVMHEFALNLNRLLISHDLKPVAIDIGSITGTVDTVADFIKPDNVVDLSRYADEKVVLLESTDLPAFRTIGQVLMILGPISLFLLSALVVFSYVFLPDKRDMLKYSSITLTVTGLILLVITFTSGGLLTVMILDPERSIIMQEIYGVFIRSFRMWQISMVVLGGILGALYFYSTVNLDFNLKPKK